MMPKLILYPALVYRTPAFDLNKVLPGVFEELKSYINDASPVFYQQIKDVSFEELQQSKDSRLFTVWKYFNRAQHRSTPFGRFAAATVVPFKNETTSQQQTQLGQEMLVHHFCDWDDAIAVQPVAQPGLKRFVITNATWYMIGGEHRYTALNDYSYRLCQIPQSEIVDFVLLQCLEKTERSAISQLLKEKFGLGKANTQQLIDELTLNQLLWTDDMPNITGEDFFARVNAAGASGKQYIIAERPILKGGEDADCLAHVPALMNFLNEYLPQQPDDYLARFKSQFLEKFDHQFVPLSIALDPELGIDAPGFNNQAVAKQDELPVLLEDKEDAATGSRSRPDSEFSAFLLNGLIAGHEVIKLEEFNSLKKSAVPPLPNTSTAIYHMYEQQPVLHSLGGCTANAMFGRFSICGGDLMDLTKNISAIEEQANPEVVFFDVSFQAEAHVDNINRRQHLYQAELSLSGWSTHDTVLQLHDIYVGIRQDELILYAARLKKRIIPRIATAYNYQRSRLDAYRFLVALQQQHLRTNLTFSIRDYIPGLDHYPRVQYYNIIVCPETWKLPETALKQVVKAGDGALSEFLIAWLRDRRINKPFHVGQADQKLVFDPADADDLTHFTAYCKQHAHQPILLSEALIDPAGEVVTESLDPLFSERILSVCHHDAIYRPFAASWLNEISQAPLMRKFYPGDDWTYLELYCHAARGNAILMGAWHDVLSEQPDLIKQWFFVRYEKGGSHLRLRFQLNQPDQSFQVVGLLRTKLANELATGLIADMRVSTYVREIERYHHGGIDNAESFFCEDSTLVLTILRRATGRDSLYENAIHTMARLIGFSFSCVQEQFNFVSTMAGQFSNEFDMNSTDYKLLNKSYKSFRLTSPTTGGKVVGASKRYVAAFSRYINACQNQEAIFNFTADAIHMHINRLFSQSQRRHEAILYQYLLSDMKKRRSVQAQTVQC